MRISELFQIKEANNFPSFEERRQKEEEFSKSELVSKLKQYVSEIPHQIELHMDGDGYLQPVFTKGITVPEEEYYSGNYSGTIGVNGIDDAENIIKFVQHEKVQFIVGIARVDGTGDFYSPQNQKLMLAKRDPSNPSGVIFVFDGASITTKDDHELQALLDSITNTQIGTIELPERGWQGPDPDDPTDDGDNPPMEEMEVYLALAFKDLNHV